VSGYVELCRPLPGAVVTYFVTGGKTVVEDLPPSKCIMAGPGVPKAKHDHGGITDDPAVATGIGELTLLLGSGPVIQTRQASARSGQAGDSREDVVAQRPRHATPGQLALGR
jgi:hypothetical protein